MNDKQRKLMRQHQLLEEAADLTAEILEIDGLDVTKASIVGNVSLMTYEILKFKEKN